ncbi:hypothetical protein [Bradyrhizobium liaoningense]|uniref:hypothetical protein n=1 Tax=Bradyrhizobium liaoningense TaxID=43992 RepID=UPI001BA4F058|nr:hypothetical protein [Bradyrhizobium liaoningense]MBR0715078.1 hypothetical protein [Bradyrhizobium liaoningense]
MSDPQLTPSSDAVAALRRHPQFSRAMRSSAEGAVAIYRTNRLLNLLLSDRARALFTHVALYLHFGGAESGLTVGAMKDLCVELRLCSRGRCEALLALMRAGGLLMAAPNPDRRKRLLAPTEKLLALHRARWARQFEAMRGIFLEAADYLVALGDPAFVRAFATALGRRFVAGLRVLDNAPELEPFAERNAGVVILFSLALSGSEGEAFPPAGPVQLSINALATNFSVSRKHVLSLLRDAEQTGLLLRSGAANNEVTLLPRGRDALEQMLATMFLYLAHCAKEALGAYVKSAKLSVQTATAG